MLDGGAKPSVPHPGAAPANLAAIARDALTSPPYAAPTRKPAGQPPAAAGARKPIHHGQPGHTKKTQAKKGRGKKRS